MSPCRIAAWASVVALATLGCGPKAPVARAPEPPVANPSWPADTLPKPEFLGTVERQAGRVAGDAEPSRIPSVYQIPDWAEPTSTISAKGPKGSQITFHLLPRDPKLQPQEEERIEGLLRGKKRSAETLVVARPWIGWFGQGTGQEAKSATQTQNYTLRVYLLFAGDRQLEVHVQWPTGDKEAFEEGQILLAHVVYSVRPLKDR